jgi:hypothetical protein
MGLNRKGGGASYERTIVDYLHEQSRSNTASGSQRAQVNQQIATLFANLHPDVRKRILKVSLEPSGEETVPVETLLDAMPTDVLVEVLNQIQVSSRNVSLPMFSLLRKFATLAESDGTVMSSLQSKLEDHKALFEELLVKRAERVFYPEKYRALLDEEFAEQRITQADPSRHIASDLQEAELNHHLAMILLEMLEASPRSEAQYTDAVTSLKDLLTGGLGEQTQSVFNEALSILGQRYATAADAQRVFFGERIQELLQPELVTCLLGALEPTKDGQGRDALHQLMEVAGAGMVSVLLNRLEVEKDLPARKRLLGLLRKCGSTVVPLAVERLRHSEWYVVRNMLLLLRDLCAVEAVPEITPCVRHASSQVRLAAFQALAALAPGGQALLEALELALQDQDQKVFRSAVAQIVSTPDAACLDLAGRFLADDPSGKRHEQQVALLTAIGQSGTTALVPLLMAVRQRGLLRFWTWRRTKRVRKAVARALAIIQSREGAPDAGRHAA